MVTIWLNRNSVMALLDSGSTITLACPSILPKTYQPCSNLAVTCMHEHVQQIPAAKVQIGGC